jgi:hypothetical protein
VIGGEDVEIATSIPAGKATGREQFGHGTCEPAAALVAGNVSSQCGQATGTPPTPCQSLDEGIWRPAAGGSQAPGGKSGGRGGSGSRGCDGAPGAETSKVAWQ